MPLLWFPRTTYRAPQALDPEHAMMREALWEPRAPASWPVQAAFIVADAAAGAAAGRLEGRAPLATALIAGGAVGALAGKLLTAGERRRGERLGLTPATSPDPRTSCLESFIQLGVWRLILRARGQREAPPRWSRVLAVRIIAEIERRRSWNRAFALARGNPQSPSAQ
jgi:hypothetical protein